ncbi:MAG: hypothetical protein HOL72_03900 [Euryarchaeota archaeon]|jgi:hypothetical protein|nr:hypothetical protein [Euryarchaeota archaeon]
MSEIAKTWKVIVMAISVPPLLLMIIAALLGDDIGSQAFKRFGNALITGYTFCAGILSINMFFYADSRKRPLAPLFGMLFATLFGAMVTLWLLSQGDLLLEENGSAMAQAFSNLVRILVSTLAMGMAVIITVGGVFVAITSRPKRKLFEEE